MSTKIFEKHVDIKMSSLLGFTDGVGLQVCRLQDQQGPQHPTQQDPRHGDTNIYLHVLRIHNIYNIHYTL